MHYIQQVLIAAIALRAGNKRIYDELDPALQPMYIYMRPDPEIGDPYTELRTELIAEASRLPEPDRTTLLNAIMLITEIEDKVFELSNNSVLKDIELEARPLNPLSQKAYAMLEALEDHRISHKNWHHEITAY